MNFKPTHICDDLVIETRVEGWLKGRWDADYYLFVQERNQWVQTDAVRNWLRTNNRLKGIIKQTSFTVEIDLNDKIRLGNNHPVYGEITVGWEVGSPRTAFSKANGLCEAVKAEVATAVQQTIQEISWSGKAVDYQETVKKEIDKALTKRFRINYGVKLTVIGCNLSAQIDDIATEGDVQMAKLHVELSLDERRRHHELGLRLLERRQEIQLAAEEVLALGNAETTVERGRWQLLQEQIAHILGPNDDWMAAMAMMFGPNAYGQLVQARRDAQEFGMEYDLESRGLDILEKHIEARRHRGRDVFASTPYVPALLPAIGNTGEPLSLASSEMTLKARMQQVLPKLQDVSQRQFKSGLEITLSWPDLKITAVTKDGRIIRAYYGRDKASQLWIRVPKKNSIEASLTQLARDICKQTDLGG